MPSIIARINEYTFTRRRERNLFTTGGSRGAKITGIIVFLVGLGILGTDLF